MFVIIIMFVYIFVICVSCYFYYTDYQSKQLFDDIGITLGEKSYM